MDNKALEQYLQVRELIASRLPDGTIDIIKEKNREMYERMFKLQDGLDALISINQKTKQQQKQFTDILAAWKRIHELGMAYAARHRAPVEAS